LGRLSIIIHHNSFPKMARMNNDTGATATRQIRHNFDLCVKPDDAEYMSQRVRRERAFQWHSRWAMPTYKQMKAQVRKCGPSLDITEADVDLLPWSSSGMMNRREYEKMQYITDHVNVQDQRQSLEAARKQRQEAQLRELEEQERLRLAVEQLHREQLEEERRAARARETKRHAEQVKRQAAWERQRQEEARRQAEEAARQKAAEAARRQAAEAERQRQVRAAQERRRQEEERRRQAEQARLRREQEERERLARQQAEAARRQAAHEAELRRQEQERQRLEQERKRQEAERRRQRRLALEQPPKLTHGESPVERAYRCYDLLNQPKRSTLLAALEKTEGLDLMEGDVDALPWNDAGTALDYPKLHALLEQEERRRQIRQPVLNLWIQEGRPTKAQFRDVILDLSRGLRVEPDELSLLSWDDHDEMLMEHDNDYAEEQERAAARRRAVLARKQREQDERANFLAPVLRRKARYSRPPPVTLGNTPLEHAYRWYTRLSGPRRSVMYSTCREGVDLQISEVDTLPWIKDGAILDFARLGELLEEIEQDRKRIAGKDDGSGTRGLMNVKDRQRQAYNWYKKLKRPRRHTFYRLVDETLGMTIQKADVDLLPWNADKTQVDESQLPDTLRHGRSSRRTSIG